MIINKIIFNLLSRKKLGNSIVLGKAGKLLRYAGGAVEMILIKLLRCLLKLMQRSIPFCCPLCLSKLGLMAMLEVVQTRKVLELLSHLWKHLVVLQKLLKWYKASIWMERMKVSFGWRLQLEVVQLNCNGTKEEIVWT